MGTVPPNGFFQFFQKDLTYQNRFLINSAGWSSVSSQAGTESVCDCDRVVTEGGDSDTSDVTKHIQSDNTEPSEERSKKVKKE